MSAVDQGLDAAVQRVMDAMGCEQAKWTPHSKHLPVWFECRQHGHHNGPRCDWTELGCGHAVKVARAAREDVPALTQQARADDAERIRLLTVALHVALSYVEPQSDAAAREAIEGCRYVYADEVTRQDAAAIREGGA